MSIPGDAPSRLFVKMKCGYDSLGSHFKTSGHVEEGSESGIVFGPAGNPCMTQLVLVRTKYKGNKYD